MTTEPTTSTPPPSDPVVPGLPLDRLRAFVRERRAIDAAEEELKRRKLEHEYLGQALLPIIAECGVPNVPLYVDGERVTVYPHHIVNMKRLEGVQSEDAIEALLASEDTKFMVKPNYNSQTLGAWCRERLADGGALPEPVLRAFEPREEIDLRVRKDKDVESTSRRSARTLRNP